MPTTTAFWLYPTSTYESAGSASIGGWNSGSASQSHEWVDDPEPYSANDGFTSWDYGMGWESAAKWFHLTYGLSAPPTGLTINKIRIYGAFFLTSSSDSTFGSAPELVAFVRPSGSSTFYTVAATVIAGCAVGGNVARVKSFAHYKRNTSEWQSGSGPGTCYWEFSTNPATGSAWTLADLNALKIGFGCATSDVTWSGYAGLDIPALTDYGSPNYGCVACTQLYVWVEAQTVAATIETERAHGSAFLRLFRRPIRRVGVVVPPEFADLDLLETFAMDHRQGPHPTPGWGKEPWSRRELVALSSRINPSTRQVSLDALDARDWRCGLWASLRSDLGFSEEGNGIPILHQGNPLTFPSSSDFRASPLQVKKQTNDPVHASCSAGFGLWTPSGMWAGFPKATNEMLHSCFSGGSGSTFTNWTHTATGGGAKAEDTTNYLIDASGFRRGCKLSNPTSGASYMSQTSGTIGGAGHYGRVRIHLTRIANASAGDNYVYYSLSRASDGAYWEESSKTWRGGVGVVWNAVDGGPTLGAIRFVSEQIDLSASTTYTVAAGFLLAGTGGVVTLNEVSLFHAASTESACGLAAQDEPLFPSTTAARTFERDFAYFDLRGDGSDVREDRGTLIVTVVPRFSHGDMSDGDVKLIWLYRRHGGLEWMRARYERVSSTAGRIYFERHVAAATSALGTTYSCYVSLASASNELAARGEAIALACRWTSAEDELDFGQRQMDLFVIARPGYAVSQATPVVYADFSGYGITASDIGGMTATYSNSLTRGSAAAGWTAGFSTLTANQRITGAGGGVSFAPRRGLTQGEWSFMLGLDQADPDKTYATIDYALYYEMSVATGQARWNVFENNVLKATGGAGSWKLGDVFGGDLGRVQVEDVAGVATVKYYVGSTLAYTSLVAPTLPLYVDSSFYDPSTSSVSSVALFGSGIAGAFGGQETWQPFRLELPGEDQAAIMAERSESGGFVYQGLEVVPYVLTDEEIERRMK